ICQPVPTLLQLVCRGLFVSYLYDGRGVKITTRASTWLSWPSLWSNSNIMHLSAGNRSQQKGHLIKHDQTYSSVPVMFTARCGICWYFSAGMLGPLDL